MELRKMCLDSWNFIIDCPDTDKKRPSLKVPLSHLKEEIFVQFKPMIPTYGPRYMEIELHIEISKLKDEKGLCKRSSESYPRWSTLIVYKKDLDSVNYIFSLIKQSLEEVKAKSRLLRV